MSYYGEAARVERCPPHTAAACHDECGASRHKGACAIASGAFRPCHTHCAQFHHLWTRWHVTSELEVFFHSAAPSAVITRKGIKSKSKTPNFYRIVCGNVKELCSINKQFTVPLSGSAVLSSDFSCHSFVERPRARAQGDESDGGGPVPAYAFPTIALLLTVGPFNELFLIVLMPCEIPIKGEAVLSYRALMRRASASARITFVAPCGDCVYTLCPTFERHSGDAAEGSHNSNNNNNSCSSGAADTVVCGGSYLSLAGARPSKLLQPLLLTTTLLHGALANSSRRTHDIVGALFTYGECLSVEHAGPSAQPRHGGSMQQHEIVLFSESGWAFNFRLADVKSAKGTDTAHFACHHPFAFARKSAPPSRDAAAVGGVNALCATIWSFQQRWNVSMWYSDACAQEQRRQPFGFSGQCGRASQRASLVLACSTSGRLLLTCSRSDPSVGFIVNVPCSYSKTSRHAPVYFPRDVVVHDAFFVEEEKNMGFLLLCRAAHHAGPAAGVVQRPHPWLRDTEASSVQLWFVPLGGGACEQMHISSFRGWNECPSSFLYSSFSLLQFASVSLREDSALHSVWEIKVRSSTCDDVLLVALAALPTVSTWLRRKADEDGAVLARLIRYSVFFYICNAEPLRAQGLSVDGAGGGGEPSAVNEKSGSSVTAVVGMSAALSLEGLLKQSSNGSEYTSHLAYLRTIVAFLETTFLYCSESEYFDEVLCACMVSVFRAVAEGWRAFTGARTWERANRSHILFFHHCVCALQELLELLQSNGSVTAITACLSHLSHYLKEEGVVAAADVRRVLCARLFDHVYPSVAQLPPISADVLGCASPSLAQVLATAKRWLEEEEQVRVLTVGGEKVPLQTVNAYGDAVKPLREVLECVKAGPTRMASVNVADVYWAARRLFLQESPQAAVSLLEQINTMGRRDQSLTELLTLYQGLSERVRHIKI